MEGLKERLLAEIPGFKEAGEKFLNGELSKMDFKKLSGGFGVYAHRDKKNFMIRLRILSGVLSKEQLGIVNDMVKRHGIDHIHLTTRQAIQFHGISMDTVCEVMKEGIEKNIYTRGAGGNYPRNVAMSPLSGLEEEAFDVVPYAMAANAYFLQRITTYKLPRKLKVSYSNNEKDGSHITVQDLGFLAVNQDGEKYFRVYLDGGLGRDPRTSVSLDKLIKAEDTLYVLEAMVQFFIAHGDYENHSKARVRYILERMGEEEFKKTFMSFLEEAYKIEGLKLNVEAPVYTKQGEKIEDGYDGVIPQKQEGLYSYYFHPIGGQLKTDIIDKILELINPMEDVHIRLSMSEGLYIVNLTGSEAKQVYEALNAYNAKNRLECSSSCIGVPICQMGLLNSQATLNNIVEKFHKEGYSKDVLPSIHISGCQNSCGVHQIGRIGFMGRMKRVDGKMCNVFELFLDGVCKIGETKLGKSYGDIPEEAVPEFLFELAKQVEVSGLNYKEFIHKQAEEVEALVEKYRV